MRITLQSATPSPIRSVAADTAPAAPSAFKAAMATAVTAHTTPAAPVSAPAGAKSSSRKSAPRDGNETKNDPADPVAAQPQSGTSATATPVLLAPPMLPIVLAAPPDLTPVDVHQAATPGSIDAALSFGSHLPAADTNGLHPDAPDAGSAVKTPEDAAGAAQHVPAAALHAKLEPSAAGAPTVSGLQDPAATNASPARHASAVPDATATDDKVADTMAARKQADTAPVTIPDAAQWNALQASAPATAVNAADGSAAGIPAANGTGSVNALPQVEATTTKPVLSVGTSMGSKAAGVQSREAGLKPRDSLTNTTVAATNAPARAKGDAAESANSEGSASFANVIKAIAPGTDAAGAGQMTGQPAGIDAAAQQAANTAAGSTTGGLQGSAPAPASGSAGAPAETTPAAAAGASYAASAPAISSAQLMQSMHGSEMRIGMHSEEFGAISINTSLSHQTLAAQISFDHSELGKALAMHVPAIEEKLGNAYGMQARVEVRDNLASMSDAGNASSGNAGRQSAGNHRGQGNGATSNASAAIHTASALGTISAVTSSASSPASSRTRLDIRI